MGSLTSAHGSLQGRLGLCWYILEQYVETRAGFQFFPLPLYCPLLRKPAPMAVETGGLLITELYMVSKSGSTGEQRAQLRWNLRQAELISLHGKFTKMPVLTSLVWMAERQQDLIRLQFSQDEVCFPCPSLRGSDLSPMCEECHPLKLRMPRAACLSSVT